jgi:hypothetical protein
MTLNSGNAASLAYFMAFMAMSARFAHRRTGLAWFPWRPGVRMAIR